MATRQLSAAGTGNVRKPRIQVVITETTLREIEDLALETEQSVSRTAAMLIREALEARYVQADTKNTPVSNNTSPRNTQAPIEETEIEKMGRLVQLMKGFKDAGLL